MMGLRKTALYDIHQRYGGKMVDFCGWALPVQFEGIIAEHEAVRYHAGLFDVSHMGEVKVKGKQALDFVQNLITNDASALEDNQVLYTLMCQPDGGIVDDLLVYRFNKEHFLLVINAGNMDKDYEWMKAHVGSYEAEIMNISDQVSEIAIQGPKAEEILQKLTDEDLSQIGFFYCRRDVRVAAMNCLISRTGYTGEDGFEIYLKHEDAEQVWEQLMKAGKELGICPCGLGARDTLRFEATLPLYGNELSHDITPLEAGLGVFVKLHKTDFIGKEALEKQKSQGLDKKIVGFEMEENGIPRHGYEIFSGEKKIGFVTTGYYAPTLKKNIGLAMLGKGYAELGTPIEIQVRKKRLGAKVISKKFYNKNYKNKNEGGIRK